MEEWRLKCNRVSENSRDSFTAGRIYKLTENGIETDNYIWRAFLTNSGNTPYDKWLKFVEEAKNIYGDVLDFTLVSIITDNTKGIDIPNTGGYIDPEYYTEAKICGVGLNRNGVIYESDVLERAVKRENTKKYEQMYRASAVGDSFVKIFEDNFIITPRRNGKSLQSINNLIDYIDYVTMRKELEIKKRDIPEGNIYIDSNWDINKEEEEMTKIEKRAEELEKSIEANEKVLSELRTTNKYMDVSTEIASQLLMIKEEKQLLKGYETLDDMYIANVIVNNNTVIVIALDGEKAVSKLSDDDSFNFLAGFFMNLVKLDSSVDNYWYDYSIHVALEDIQNGNL